MDDVQNFRYVVVVKYACTMPKVFCKKCFVVLFKLSPDILPSLL